MRLLLSGLLLLALGVMVYESLRIDGGGAPYPIAVSLGALACALIVGAGRRRAAEGATELPDWLQLSRRGAARLAGFAALWTAYVLLLPELGFTLASWLAIALSLAVLRGRPTLTAALGSAVFVVVFVLLIKSVLYVPVPMGWLDTRIEELLYTL